MSTRCAPPTHELIDAPLWALAIVAELRRGASIESAAAVAGVKPSRVGHLARKLPAFRVALRRARVLVE